MNLIEQLGGYEETKKHLDSCWCDDDNRAYLLEKLLEYRRRHNIFEVEDKVVFNSYELDAGIGEIQAYHNGCIGAVFRHATDEEIKAGYRL